MIQAEQTQSQDMSDILSISLNPSFLTVSSASSHLKSF